MDLLVSCAGSPDLYEPERGVYDRIFSRFLHRKRLKSRELKPEHALRKQQNLQEFIRFFRSRSAACLSAAGLLLGGPLLGGCDIKLPSPPPDLFYKFNVLPVGQGPSHLLTLDLNRDGEADIVSANAKNSTLSLMYGKGDGTFRTTENLRVPQEPTSLAAGDLNGDGLLDLAANSRGTHSLTVLMQRADGSFRRLKPHPTGRVPLAVILDDFNADGLLDAAVTLTFDKLEIHIGRGNGTFSKGETYYTGSRSFSGVSGDFNGDGHRDLAVAATSSGASSLRVFWGNGDGTFQKPSRLIEGLMPLAVTARDMNADGKEDLIVGAGQGDNMYLILSNGDGTFQKETAFSGGGGPMSLVAEHFNDDDRMDVAVANSRSSSFSLIIRRPDGRFRYPTRDYVVEGGTPLAITSGDYNDDGMMDIAVASNAVHTVEVYLRRRILQ